MKQISAKNACTSIEQCYQTCSALGRLVVHATIYSPLGHPTSW